MHKRKKNRKFLNQGQADYTTEQKIVDSPCDRGYNPLALAANLTKLHILEENI
jgi:hypothetical protein